MTTTPSRALRRILIALDATTHSPRSMRGIVDLAARLESELIGLFVEDAELLRIADFGLVRRIRLTTAADEAFDLASTERELRAMAEALRRGLAEAAEQHGVKWSFRVVRGDPLRELATAAIDADVLVVYGTARPPAPRRTGAGRARPADLIATSVLVLPPEPLLSGPVLVAFDGSAESVEALDVARVLSGALAPPGTVGLEVLLCAESADAARALREVAIARGPLPHGAIFRHVAGRLDDVAERLRVARGALVVVGGSASHERENVTTAALRELAERMHVPLLVVRARR